MQMSIDLQQKTAGRDGSNNISRLAGKSSLQFEFWCYEMDQVSSEAVVDCS